MKKTTRGRDITINPEGKSKKEYETTDFQKRQNGARIRLENDRIDKEDLLADPLYDGNTN